MSEETLKHILIDVSDEVSDILDKVLNELNVEVYADDLARDDFDYVFTENLSYPAEENTCVVVITSEVYDGPFFTIQKNHLSSPLAQKAIRRFLGENTSINLEQVEVPKELRSYKITNRFSRGYYFDLVSSLASEFSFDFERIGANFLTAINTIFNDFQSLPIEFEVIIGEDYFATQIHFMLTKWSNESFIKTSRLVEDCFYDSYFIKESKTAVIGLYHFKNISGKSVVVCEEEKSGLGNFESEVYNTLTNIVDYKIVDNIESIKKTSALSKVKKIIDFIKHSKFPEGTSFEDKLSAFPDSIIVSQLGKDDIDFIRAVINDGKVYEALSASIIGHKDDLFKNDDFPEKIASALEEMEFYEFTSFFDSESEAIQKISGVTENLTEENTLVSGRVDEDEFSQVIKGTKEDLGPENFLVSGSREDLSKQKWQVKRLEVAKKVKDELRLIAESGVFDHQVITDRVKAVVRESFSLEESDDNIANGLNNSVIDSAATKSIESEISSERSADEIFLKLENDRYKGQINKKNDQIIRMKRIIDSMKSDYVANKKAEQNFKESITSGDDVSNEQKLKSVGIQLELLSREVKNKELTIEQMERAQAHTIKNRDHRISLLEEKLADATEAATAVTSNEFESKSRIKELELKNKQFENQLNVAESRIKSLSKKYDDEMKNRVQIEMNGSGLDKLLADEKYKVNQLLEKISVLENASSNQKANDIVEELDSSKEKIRELESHLKESQIESKKFEQKMKFMTSQMSELEKKLKKVAGRAGGASGGATNDKRLKQLEGNMQKINILKSKAEEELAKKEKKRIVINKKMVFLLIRLMNLKENS